MTFTEDYDPGFLNVPGFGQSATNPLSPVFYRSLGVVDDLSVYNSIYAANTISANVAFSIGKSYLTQKQFSVGVVSDFQEPVTCERTLKVNEITETERLFVKGDEYVETTVVGKNGTFKVLAKV